MEKKDYNYKISTMVDQVRKLGEDIIASIVLQALGFFFAGMILDGGFCLMVFKINIIAWWIAFLLILLRRAGNLTKFDKFYVKYGIFVNVLLITPIVVLLGIFVATY